MLHSNNKRDLLSSMARYCVVNTRLSNPNLFINWIVIDVLFFISAYQKKWIVIVFFFNFSLSKEAKQDAAVKHALAVHASVLSGNYVLFFKLYKAAPNLNSCLMGKEQYTSLKCILFFLEEVSDVVTIVINRSICGADAL